MNRGRFSTVLLLLVAITASGVWVVHTKYLTRLHFSQLQDLRAQRDALDVQWNRLRLEEAALSTDVRVERKARDELGMYLPRVGDVMLIEEVDHDRP
ncbi:cell division protein FtsL [uncultured Thiodictyon sp.]|uniref:cell division protein FtsL n=1 Tax=uncultured Thiodictyon sp. TaxID=1846217 RepID=UPI0025EC1BC4|nr:cell division protein FtsL [uncultured Thiodictyon sp.]